jgi:beta-lactam-binding protein with PASTA domain
MTRSPLAAALALLGIAAAAAAAVWYASIRHRTQSPETTLPRVIGMSQRAAVRELTHDGFRVRVVEPKGLGSGGVVVGETPLAETLVARGTTVTLRVARR